MDCNAQMWVDQFEKLGLPLVMLMLFFYAVYLSFRWIAPRADHAMSSYFALANRKAELLEESSSKCLQLQEAHLSAIKELTTLIQQLEVRCQRDQP